MPLILHRRGSALSILDAKLGCHYQQRQQMNCTRLIYTGVSKNANARKHGHVSCKPRSTFALFLLLPPSRRTCTTLPSNASTTLYSRSMQRHLLKRRVRSAQLLLSVVTSCPWKRWRRRAKSCEMRNRFEGKLSLSRTLSLSLFSRTISTWNRTR